MDERLGRNVVSLLFIDAIVFGLMVLLTHVGYSVKPTERGFFCDDESIRYPKKASTVPTSLVYGVGLSLSVFAIVLMEYRRQGGHENERFPYRLGKYRVRASYWNIYRMFASHVSGLWFSQAMVLIGKVSIGRLRPNFIDVCRPDLERLCSNPNSYLYIESVNCSLVDTSDSRLSFPSGHAYCSFYVAVFLVLYLQKTWKVRSTMAKSFLQFVLVALAWYVSLSRVMDYKHHWSDVLVGMLIGTTVAVLNMVFVVSTFFDSKKPPSRSNFLSSVENNTSSTDEKLIVPLLEGKQNKIQFNVTDRVDIDCS